MEWNAARLTLSKNVTRSACAAVGGSAGELAALTVMSECSQNSDHTAWCASRLAVFAAAAASSVVKDSSPSSYRPAVPVASQCNSTCVFHHRALNQLTLS